MARVDGRRRPLGERTRYELGTFCWVGLASSDREAAERFYTSLFGWEAESLSAGAAGTFTMLRQAGQHVAILYRQQPEARAAGARPHWTSFISVEDADATAARAGELGGAAVFREPFDVLDAGRVAAIRDPTGSHRLAVAAALADRRDARQRRRRAVLQRARDDGLRAKEGGLRRAARLGVRGRRERLYVDHQWGPPERSIRAQTEQERGTPANWLPYFTVDNADDALHRAERAGGHTLVPATESHIGRFAVIADPQAAAFAVFEGETDP